MKRWLIIGIVTALTITGLVGACAPAGVTTMPEEGATLPEEGTSPPSEEEAPPPEEVTPPPAEEDEAPPAEESQTYTNSEYGFSVEYPKDWDVLEDYMGMTVIFVGPIVLESRDQIYYVNLSVLTEQLGSQWVTVEDYVTASELTAKRTVPNFEKEEEYTTTIAGLPAIVVIATMTMEFGDEEEILIRDKYGILVKDEIGYTIGYDVPAEFYDDYADCFDLVISTFEFE